MFDQCLRLLAPQLKSRSAGARPSPSRLLPSQNQDRPSSQADGSCYTELHPSAHGYVERLRVEDQPRTEDGDAYCLPVVEAASSFRPSVYVSALMAKENKPLEVGILRRAKELLAEVDPRTAAKHITKADCTVPTASRSLAFVQKPPSEEANIYRLFSVCLPGGQNPGRDP